VDQHKRQVKLLSVVFSFKNEEENLPELLKRLRAVMKSERQKGSISNHEFVFVNDASTDRSLEILKELQSGDITIINMSRTFGVTPCVLAGFQYAKGDAVVYMDADLQDPPETISDMLEAYLSEETDVVHTVRLSRSGESRIKMLVTKLGYSILQKTTDIQIIPNAGDFKLLSRRAVNQLIKFREKKPFMRGLVHWIGFRQTRVNYHRQARHAGETKFPIFSPKVIRNFFESALISFSEVPLYLVSLSGLIISMLSFVYLAYVIVQKFSGHNLPGWSAIMVTMLFLGGVQLVGLGVIGLYISSIYGETQGRPNYIVEGTNGGSAETSAPHPPAEETKDSSDA